MTTSRNALVVVVSNIESDPRVRREIDWLSSEGWTVDSLGLGDHPSDLVREHFRMAPVPKWIRTKPGLALYHALFSNRRKFAINATAQIPSAAIEKIRGGEYELIVFNDIDLLPLVADAGLFAKTRMLHLDIHEYFPPRMAKGSLFRFRVESHYLWVRRFLAHPAFRSRTAVAHGIAELYANEFQFPTPIVVRNAPPFEQQSPQPVSADRIELLYHGNADWRRGLSDIVDAMRLVDDRFHMTFMLPGPRSVIDELTRYAADVPERVSFVPGVPMTDIATAINKYDLEIMYYRPATQNLLLALPNKLFEAVQGRLGLVIGESPMMREIVEESHNGIVVEGWGAEQLAAGLNSLTAESVSAMKRASDAHARDLSAEHEKTMFLSAISDA